MARKKPKKIVPNPPDPTPTDDGTTELETQIATPSPAMITAGAAAIDGLTLPTSAESAEAAYLAMIALVDLEAVVLAVYDAMFDAVDTGAATSIDGISDFLRNDGSFVKQIGLRDAMKAFRTAYEA